MILKGNQRAGGSQLAAHLMNDRDNDHVTVHELRGFVSDSLAGAFNETYAISRGTRAKQYLFSLSLNPPETAEVSIEVFENAISSIEKRLGLSNQPRAIVFHEKAGRRHAHCVWSRINMSEMRAINLPHYKMKLRNISRALYREHEWQIPRGLINSAERDQLNFTREESQQASRTKSDAKSLKRVFEECWEASDSQISFEVALKDHGLYLAKGDRRGYVAINGQGEIYSLTRWTGRTTKVLRSRLRPLQTLHSIDETKREIAKRLERMAVGLRFAPNQRTARKTDFYLAKCHELICRQRIQRAQLKSQLVKRSDAERTERRQRLPTGLQALWFRLTGAYYVLRKEIEAEAAACTQRDRQTLSKLANKQLLERRNLKRLHRGGSQNSYSARERLSLQISTAGHSSTDSQPAERPTLVKRQKLRQPGRDL